VQALLATVVFLLPAALLAFVGSTVRRSGLAARAYDWLPVVATLGTALGVAAIAVPAADLPEPVVAFGAAGLAVGLIAAYTIEWRYGVLDVILVAFAMFLTGVGAQLYI
jgi:hypothetical protein